MKNENILKSLYSKFANLIKKFSIRKEVKTPHKGPVDPIFGDMFHGETETSMTYPEVGGTFDFHFEKSDKHAFCQIFITPRHKKIKSLDLLISFGDSKYKFQNLICNQDMEVGLTYITPLTNFPTKESTPDFDFSKFDPTYTIKEMVCNSGETLKDHSWKNF